MTIRKTISALAILGLALAAPLSAAAQTPPESQPEARQFPNRNGPLAGMALFIPEAQTAEFHKPPHEAPRVSILHQVKVGEVVALKVTFVGPQLDDDKQVDITFDVDFIGPDGKALPAGSMRNLKVVNGPVSAPEAVFDNTAVVPMVSFDATDPKGLYKAVVVLHDNVAGRDLPMTAEITLQ
ncbi:MAG: hypothetical protein QM608_09295 [Caulobacter sp.]